MTTFRRYKVQPDGRNKYGHYYSKENVKSNITYAMYNGNTSTEEIPTGNNDTGSQNPIVYILFLLSTQGVFSSSEISAASSGIAETRVVSYANNNPVSSFIGNFNDSGDTHYGITGYPSSGMSFNILNSGTSATTLQIIVSTELNQETGTLSIPCYIPKNGLEGMTTWDNWKVLYDNGDLFYRELQYDWAVAGNGDSVFFLDLTNETGGINCDAEGHVLPGSVLPDSWAKLYYGEDVLTGATYSIYVAPAYDANGVNFNTNTGYLYFSPNLSFNGTTLVIEVTGVYNGISRSKKFTLTKNMPGEDGQPAVTKWLETSVDEIIFDPNTSAFTPSSVSCRVLKQVGSGTPEEITSSETVYYRFSGEANWIAGTNVTVNISLPLRDYVVFALATPNFTIYEQETVHIVKNGLNGDPGSGTTGPAGPAVRGPIDWYSGITENRRFCNGRGPLAEDARFIDILLKDGTYYQCNISYDATPNDSWSSVSGNWTAADEAYNFVATELLLAENAKIKFLSNNALYLMSGNTVTGGAQGGSGNTIAFWAGSSNENNAPFKVDHSGKLTATGARISGEINAESGTFAGYIRMPYTNVYELTSAGTAPYALYFSADTRAYIVDPGGMATSLPYGRTIYLPDPNSSLNGFTYYVLCRGWRVGTQTASQTYNTYIKVIGDTDKIISCVNGYAEEEYSPWCRAGLYSGLNQFTCVYMENDWHWVWVSAPEGGYLENRNGNTKWWRTTYTE